MDNIIEQTQLSPDNLLLNIAIIGYKSDLMGHWDPSGVLTGLPGSEECAVYASNELARRGHKVTVFMNPSPESVWRCDLSNPRWLSVDDYDKSNIKYDLVMMWRRFDVDTGRQHGKIVFFWPHDSPQLPPNKLFPPFPKFDGICILSEHHRGQFNKWPGFCEIPYIVSGNGIVPDQFQQPMNFTNPYSVGYFSNYARGLVVLMLIWPDIRKEFPQATLSICYGRETWGTMPPNEFDFVVNKIMEYNDIGVIEHGKIGHRELACIMQKTSVWAYPCNYLGETETFCITAVKCQASGCIPVTTRIGALNETVHPDAPSSQNIKSINDVEAYKNTLLAQLRRIGNTDPNIIKHEREKYINFSKTFSWAACVDKWLTLYSQITHHSQ